MERERERECMCVREKGEKETDRVNEREGSSERLRRRRHGGVQHYPLNVVDGYCKEKKNDTRRRFCAASQMTVECVYVLCVCVRVYVCKRVDTWHDSSTSSSRCAEGRLRHRLYIILQCV